MASNVKGKGDLARDAPDAEGTGDLERKRILHCNRAAFIRFTHFFLEVPVNDNTCGMMLTITVKKRGKHEYTEHGKMASTISNSLEST